MPAAFGVIRRIREDNIKLFLRTERPQVLVEDSDFFLQMIEGYILHCQLIQRFLNLQRGDLTERLKAQKERDDPVPGAQLEQLVVFIYWDEVSQQRGINRETITTRFLQDMDSPMEKGVKGFILTSILNHCLDLFRSW